MTLSTSQPSSSSLARIEPLLLLAKSARGAAAAKLIIEATAAPGCYLFSELAHTQGIKTLAEDPAYASCTSLLNLFLYGTLSDYLTSPASYPTLTQNHITKLRQLTLVSLASSARSLDYTQLLADLKLNVYIADGALQIDGIGGTVDSSSTLESNATLMDLATIRALEDVIIDAMYAGLLTGRLDQKTRRFHVDSVLGRDVGGDAELKQMEDSLQSWGDTTTALLAELAQRIERAKEESAMMSRVRDAHEQELGGAIQAVQQQQQHTSGHHHHHQSHSYGPGGGGGQGYGSANWQLDEDEMDLDAMADKKGGGTKKSRSKRTRT